MSFGGFNSNFRVKIMRAKRAARKSGHFGVIFSKIF